MHNIFISHYGEDEASLDRLKQRLRDHGCDVRNSSVEKKKYRPYKQIEERLNRTYKQNYYGTNGYFSLECANSYMVLYVAFFNFLRRHSSLGFKTPVDDDLFDENDLMMDKWLKLIKLAHQYNKALQA